MTTAAVDPVDLTQTLIRIESTSRGPGQGRVMDLVADQLRAAGFTLHSDAARPERFLLALSRATGPRLLFVCHVDTVPVDQPDSWAVGPTSGELADGRVYGRGASDMKGGLAAAVAALLDVGPDGPPCALLLTTDEEVGCLGAAAARETVAEQDVGAVVIPESTLNRVVLGHRGVSWLRLSAQGRAAHAGAPELGRNALLMLAAALLDVADAAPGLGDRSPLGVTTVNVATMQAGTAPNIVPETAQAVVDVRAVADGAAGTISAWVAERHPGVTVAVDLDLPPVSTPADHPWIRRLPVELAVPPTASYFTDAAELVDACPGAPVAIWGPGDPSLAHGRDEYVSADLLTLAAEAYAHALREWPASVSREHRS